MVSLFFVTKFSIALVTGQENLAGSQFPCFHYEISKAESLLACFESNEESLLDWAHQHHEASARGINKQSVMIRWSSACSKCLDVSRLNYADVFSLAAMRAAEDIHAWNVLAMSCLMLLK